MRRSVVVILLALAAAGATAPAAHANHRCYTLGDYQVCHHVPGDEVLDDLLH